MVSPEYMKVPENIPPQLVVLDFDRTLGNVDASMERLYLSAESIGIDTSTIKKAREQVENDGGSFDPFSLIQEQGEEKLQSFIKNFTSLHDIPILYPDAVRLLQRLQLNAIPYHVLTYGVNPDWQRLKIQASRYNGTISVMDSVDKGTVIAAWRNQDNIFSIPETEARGVKILGKEVCLIDDKSNAFTNLPEDCTGFLVKRDLQELPSQKGVLTENICIIRNLDDITLRHHMLVG